MNSLARLRNLIRSSGAWFALTLAAIAGFTALGPAEKSLGSNIRVVYLHGAWVWTALAAFLAAGVAGSLAEPRFRLAVIFAVGGVLLQLGRSEHPIIFC